ncbi:MAG: hypothetical protein OEL76_14370 [Siculibacillus sp.]|nr:hypothetical protein [Siculibacillus sp.]
MVSLAGVLKSTSPIFTETNGMVGESYGLSDYSPSDLVYFFGVTIPEGGASRIIDTFGVNARTIFAFGHSKVYEDLSAELRPIIDEHGVTCEILASVDLDTDNELFARAEDFIEGFSAAAAVDLPLDPTDPLARFSGEIGVGMTDYVAAAIRFTDEFTMKVAGRGKIFVYCSSSIAHYYLFDEIYRLNRWARIVVPSLFAPQRAGSRRIIDTLNGEADLRVDRTILPLSGDFRREILDNAVERDVFYVTNLGDKQYALTVMALLRRLGDRRMHVFSIKPPGETFEQFAAAGRHEVADWACSTLRRATSTLQASGDLDLYLDAHERVLDSWRRSKKGRINGRDLFVAATYAQRLALVASTAVELVDLLRTTFARARPGRVAVSSGRSMEARLSVAIAEEFGIGTLDVQAGATSKSRRFRRPTAQRCTCIDRAHWNIYHDHFGMPAERIEVCGSPRIDLLLEPIRRLDPAEARRRWFSGFSDRPILFVATQPIEFDRIMRIAEVAMSAADVGWGVVIKPHPNEPERHITAYRDMAARRGHGDDVLVDRSIDVYEGVRGADVVAAYFSTVAQEAFALRKPVLVIDPFPAPPELDFVAMGIARRVASPEELRGVLESARGESPASSDPFLSVLQDGLAADRVRRLLCD